MDPELHSIYPVSSNLLPQGFAGCPAATLPELLREHPELCGHAPFLADLATIERAVHHLNLASIEPPAPVTELTVRPGVELFEVDWTALPEMLAGQTTTPRQHRSLVLIVPPVTGRPARVLSPTDHQLLALKIAAEQLDQRTVARQGGVSVQMVDRLVADAVQHGLLLAPTSRITRPPSFSTEPPRFPNRLRAEVFTLQWHITQACDLHCRHCYDRSSRQAVTAEQGTRVLDQFSAFCKDHHVDGQVSFSGGNPLLHPRFFEFYAAAAERGLMTAILGNPTDQSTLQAVKKIQAPEFYQVSLEGLREHNDYIRGTGHFDRTLAFLELARELNVYTMVMLTLTRDNLDQVLPLAEQLRGRVDLFTFNRLAMMGEGAALAVPPIERYESFLENYLEAAATNPIMSTKDSLFNIILERQGRPVRGGCAGFGCGAAFNFVALLPDGEIHACRKLPSLLGNLYQDSLAEIYHSPLAERYREGSSACRSCRLRPVCRGCPAVVSGLGQDIFKECDPYCFITSSSP
ncbi:MAG: thio(seleno)oxazole modification radical SAM maturase SbtM [Desulfofustis sp.]|jgi:selenobiotic family peptide radical SAM maturase|nr:thio(seleno)oxazole modification radical SAM maturase SbtM [Desulfofustis sp.]